MEFLKGEQLYKGQLYSEAIVHLENSYLSYWEALEDCRMSCEISFDHGWLPDFIPAIASITIAILFVDFKTFIKGSSFRDIELATFLYIV